MRILMISSTFPYPPSRGGTETRTFNLLKYLYQHHEVTLVTQRQTEVSDTEVAALSNWVSELVVFPLPDPSYPQAGIDSLRGKAGRLAASLWQGTPPNVLHRYSPEIQTWVDAYVRAGKCEAITCEHSVNAIYVRPEFRTKVLTVLNLHSLGYGWIRNHLQMGASENVLRDRLYLTLLYRYEKRYSTQFSRIVVTTEDDRQQLLDLCPQAQIHVIPNGVDLEVFPYRSAQPEGYGLIFIGAMDGSHNIDAVRFFVLQVLPELQHRYPDTTFSIVGSRPVAEVLALGDRPGVTVTGRVPSMAAYLHRATVCVLPLRTGFGIKNKTLEAMAAGTPIVASDRGLEGLTVDGDGVPLRALRANTPAECIAAIGQLFEHPQLGAELSRNGRQLVETEYSWDDAGQRYERVLQGKKD